MLLHVWLQVPYTVHSSKSGKNRKKRKVWTRKKPSFAAWRENKAPQFLQGGDGEEGMICEPQGPSHQAARNPRDPHSNL